MTGWPSTQMIEWLTIATETVVIVINAMALVIVAVGTLQAFLRALAMPFGQSAHIQGEVGCASRAGWWPHSRSNSPPTFIETSITASRDALGRIAAIALIRTFLNHFLDRDVAETREQQEDAARAAQ